MTIAVAMKNDAPIAVKTPTSDQPTSKDVATEKSYWQDFYSRFTVSIPSTWCVTTAIEADKSRPIVEFGCGNGRDSIYFASHGYTVYGCDLSSNAVELNNKRAEGMDNLEFRVADVSVAEQVRAVIERARSAAGGGNVTIYTRFFLHSIDQEQEDKFVAALSSSLMKGDKLYFEYRSTMDETLDKVHGKGHYRRYVDTQALMEELRGLGFAMEYEVTGRGMAKYKQEDPYVSRIIARKV